MPIYYNKCPRCDSSKVINLVNRSMFCNKCGEINVKVLETGFTKNNIKDRETDLSVEPKPAPEGNNNFDVLIIKYSEVEVQEWERLYEILGSFRAVSKHIREKNGGKGPSASTITKRLREKFEREGRNFNAWVELHSIGYSDAEVQEWEHLYELLGSFKLVSKRLKEGNGGIGPNGSMIAYRLRKKFERERRDFDSWAEKFSLYKLILSKKHYLEEELDKWEQLYERFGSFAAVSRYIKEQNGGNGPTVSTIILRLKAKFKLEERDFDDWVNQFFYPNSDIAANIGCFVHLILEVIFMKFTLKKNLKTFFEIILNVLEKKIIIDNIIITPFQSIKITNIDYTITSNIRQILEKCFRGYHGPEQQLIIVLFISDKVITLPEEIPNRDMIKVFNATEFTDYMGYSGELLEEYNFIRYLARNAFYDNDAYNELAELSKFAKSELNQLTKKYLLSQKDFEKYIESLGLDYLLY